MKLQTPAIAPTQQQPYIPIKKSTVEPANLVAYWFKDSDGKLFRRWVPESTF
ncbi:MAG: hypothetical protein HC799_17835 [Limnothrix sp. RL_2_0]|nr:hypothetical protein [Limnothrix sp. RL_2_0]